MPQELLIDLPGRSVSSGLLESYRPPRGGSDPRLKQLLSEFPLRSEGRFGCYLLAASSSYSDIARAIECQVFQKFFGNVPAEMAREYAEYEDSSLFFLVVERETQRAAGVLRVIENSAAGFKTLNDIQGAPLCLPTSKVLAHHGIDDLSRCWDVGTLAVVKEFRGQSHNHIVSTMLYGLLHTEVCKRGIDHVITVLDSHAYVQLTQMLGVPFMPIAHSEPFSYLGSENSRAAYVHSPHVRPAVEAFMSSLDENVRRLLAPHVGRLIYSDGVPEVIEVR